MRTTRRAYFERMLHLLRAALPWALLAMASGLFAQADSLSRAPTEPQVLSMFELVRYGRSPVVAQTTLDSASIQVLERSSLRNALLTTPGVQVDERGHGGSTRVSIRGSLLRSPFGVRGVKVYWGPFPLTLADGSTPLEMLDPVLVDELDVVRSVGAAAFGAAPNGSILADLAQAPAGTGRISAEALAGGFGFQRYAVRGTADLAGNSIAAGGVHQRNAGYRDQEGSARDQVFLAGQWVGERTTLISRISWQKASWELPGSLDSLTAYDAPRSARDFSERIDAHVAKEQAMAGLASRTRLAERLRLHSSVSAQLIDKENPYGTSPASSGFKTEAITQATGRTSVLIDLAAIDMEAGLEALAERDRLQEATCIDFAPGPLRTDADTRIGNVNAFASATIPWGRHVVAEFAFGMERTHYRHKDLLEERVQDRSPGTFAHPALGLAIHGSAVNGRLRYAESTSRPTVWELLGSEGRFNNELVPERVRELEAGLGSADSSAVLVRLAVYGRWIDDAIVSRIDPLTEAEHFENDDGRTVISGVEAQVNARWGRNNGWHGWARSALTLQRAVQESSTGSTQPPGLPPFQGTLLVRAMHGRGYFLDVLGRAMGAVHPSSAAAPFPAYAVVNATVGRTFRAWAGDLEVACGFENVFDQRYTGFVQFNDPGARYYNPAPGRTMLVRLGWRMNGGTN